MFCKTVFKHGSDIDCAPRSYNASFRKNLNLTAPRLSTAFSRLGLYFLLINFCVEFGININVFFSFEN